MISASQQSLCARSMCDSILALGVCPSHSDLGVLNMVLPIKLSCPDGNTEELSISPLVFMRTDN